MAQSFFCFSGMCIGVVAVLASGVVSASAVAQGPFHVEQKWVIGGEGGWDYVTVDSASHRLYVAHQTKVDVVDLNSGKVIGTIGGLTRCHGVVILPGGKTGFVSDGGAGQVVVFDPATFATLGTIPAGKNPDGMVYEGSTKTLWAFNGTSKDATVIDVVSRRPVATIALPGKPEFPQTDDRGTVFVNIEDTNSIVRLDAAAKKMTATWKLSECDSPSGLAYDREGERLFSVCDGKKMAVTDAKTGRSLGTPSVGVGPDAAAYDAKSKLAFASNGDGTLTVVDAGKPGYPVLQSLTTMKGARTMGFDPATGKIYTVTAQLGPAPAATAASPRPRPVPVPGTFTVLVIGR